MSIPVGVPPAVGGPACHVNRSPASNVLGADTEAGCKPWNVFRNVHPGESAAAGAAVTSAAPASAATRVTKQSANRAGRARRRSDRSVIKVPRRVAVSKQAPHAAPTRPLRSASADGRPDERCRAESQRQGSTEHHKCQEGGDASDVTAACARAARRRVYELPRKARFWSAPVQHHQCFRALAGTPDPRFHAVSA